MGVKSSTLTSEKRTGMLFPYKQLQCSLRFVDEVVHQPGRTSETSSLKNIVKCDLYHTPRRTVCITPATLAAAASQSRLYGGEARSIVAAATHVEGPVACIGTRFLDRIGI